MCVVCLVSVICVVCVGGVVGVVCVGCVVCVVGVLCVAWVSACVVRVVSVFLDAGGYMNIYIYARIWGSNECWL